MDISLTHGEFAINIGQEELYGSIIHFFISMIFRRTKHTIIFAKQSRSLHLSTYYRRLIPFLKQITNIKNSKTVNSVKFSQPKMQLKHNSRFNSVFVNSKQSNTVELWKFRNHSKSHRQEVGIEMPLIVFSIRTCH